MTATALCLAAVWLGAADGNPLRHQLEKIPAKELEAEPVGAWAPDPAEASPAPPPFLSRRHVAEAQWVGAQSAAGGLVLYGGWRQGSRLIPQLLGSRVSAEGKADYTFNLEGRHPVDLSPDGKLLAVVGKEMVGIVGLGPKKASVRIPWRVPEEEQNPVAMWAGWVGNDALLTGGRHLILWAAGTAAPQWRVAAPGAGYALSPGRRQVAVMMPGKGPAILNARTGEVLHRCADYPSYDPCPDRPAHPKLRFRPDGEKLIAVLGRRLLAWDLATGVLRKDMTLLESSFGGVPICGPGNWVAVGDALYDLKREIPAWRFPSVNATPPWRLQQSPEGLAVATGSEGGGVFALTAKLPPDGLA